MPAPEPSVCVAGIRGAHEKLLATLEDIDDAAVRTPSLLPDWTVGHVLSHLARNADSVVRRLEGAARGEVVDQYVGGPEGRAAEIEAGAGRLAAELADDVRRTAVEVEQVCAALPPEAWDRLTRSVDGAEQPARQVVFSRWREVEVHLVDLGLGYQPSEWPAQLVAAWLPDVLDGAVARTDAGQLLAWLLGRADPPSLRPWD